MSIDADGNITTPLRASDQDGSYPRPQLVRERWRNICGTWGFAYDDADEGNDARWFVDTSFERNIIVPFPPESTASGIGDTGFHRVVWYSREITADDIFAAGKLVTPQTLVRHPSRLTLHFGAVDYRAQVWLDGNLLGSHEGGHTPFSFDITRVLDEARNPHTLVVRAEDDAADISQPRGKQDWQRDPHAVWYHRTTGIWQPVWLEIVPATSVRSIQWVPDVPAAEVTLSVTLSRTPAPGAVINVDIDFGDEPHGRIEVPVSSDKVVTRVRLPRLANGQGYEDYLWSPEHPRLFDATITLTPADNVCDVDVVRSYFGMRSAQIGSGHFLLNDRPYPVRSVLSQGYWPESHLAAPSPAALRAEAQLIKDLGFNAARVHQKIEDPRFLYWADRLGIMIWGEAPSAFEFSTSAVNRTMSEWAAAIERDLSHPSIVTWVPLNESWGVQHIAHEPRVQAYSRAIFELTKALDSSRPVVSNDGWEHLDSDIWSIHDYEASADALRKRYTDARAVSQMLEGFGPAGRRLRLAQTIDRGQPVMLTEFGGIRYSPEAAEPGVWGYSHAESAEDFERRLRELFGAVRASSVLAGHCYTQLTDTLQEANGLVDEKRQSKLPLERIYAIVTGHNP